MVRRPKWIGICLRVFVPDVRLGFTVQAHDDVVEDIAVNSWRKMLCLGEVKIRFGRSKRSIASSGKYKKIRPMPYGTMRVEFGKGSCEWHFKMLRFLELAAR